MEEAKETVEEKVENANKHKQKAIFTMAFFMIKLFYFHCFVHQKLNFDGDISICNFFLFTKENKVFYAFLFGVGKLFFQFGTFRINFCKGFLSHEVLLKPSWLLQLLFHHNWQKIFYFSFRILWKKIQFFYNEINSIQAKRNSNSWNIFHPENFGKIVISTTATNGTHFYTLCFYLENSSCIII